MQVLAEREERGTALGHTMLRSLSNPELHGGEAIDIADVPPTEFDTSIGTERDRTEYTYAMLRYHKEYNQQACSWYHTVDIASFIRDEDEEAVRQDQERMRETPTANAPGAAGPVYQAGSTSQDSCDSDAEIEPAYQWIGELFGTIEDYVASRKRDYTEIEDDQITNLTRGKRNKRVMRWVPVGSRQEEESQ